MSDQGPIFSAIVVSYHTGAVLNQCLEALFRAPHCGQVIVVNNGNPPHVEAELRALTDTRPGFVLLEGHGNIGFGRGCNFGAERATGNYLLFVNPDCIIDPETLPAFLDTFRRHPDALLGGALRNQDGSEQRGGRRGELTLWSAMVSFSGLGRAGEGAGVWRDFNRHREVVPAQPVAMPTLSGALMAISKTSFDALEGFDSAYFLHVEDVDLCKRARIMGLPVLYVPAATALHIGATSVTTSFTLARAKVSSFLYYFWTHCESIGERLAILAIMPFLALAIMARALLPSKG